MKTLTLQTGQKAEVVNVTQQLAEMVAGVQDGLAFFSTPHTTAALFVCEDDDELRADLIHVAQDLFANLRPFKHVRNNNPNAEAHLMSAMLGTSLVIAVENGKLQLGSYQNILFLELDGPKLREIRCRVVHIGPFS